MERQTNTKKQAGWRAVREHLESWNKPALLGLLKDLYETSGANRDFISARCTAEDVGASLESYRRRVIEPFYPARGEAKLKLGEARKAIREYRKATGHIPGTIELLLTYSEAGSEFTNEFGDIDERFYASLCSALDELADLLRSEGKEAWLHVAERMETLAENANGIGWGYGDYVQDVVGDLSHNFSTEK